MDINEINRRQHAAAVGCLHVELREKREPLPVNRLRLVLGDRQMARYEELRKRFQAEVNRLRNEQPELAGDAAAYWAKAQAAFQAKRSKSSKIRKKACWAAEAAREAYEALELRDQALFRDPDQRELFLRPSWDTEWTLPVPRLPIDDLFELTNYTYWAQLTALEEIVAAVQPPEPTDPEVLRSKLEAIRKHCDP